MRKLIFFILILAGCSEEPSEEDVKRDLEVQILMAKNFSGFVCKPNGEEWIPFEDKFGQYFTCIRYDGLVTRWAVIDDGESFIIRFVEELHPANSLQSTTPRFQTIGDSDILR